MKNDPKYFAYDFKNLEIAMARLKINQSNEVLVSVKDELNKFFTDATCINILYNINTDKLFFGMCVMPVLKDRQIDVLIKGEDEKVKISEYYVEIDSKLIDLNLSPRELIACLLHEVGHVINDTSGTERIKNAVAIYLAQKQQIVNQDLEKDREVYRLGITTGISKLDSIFGIDDDEVIADSFVVACGYGDDLSSAYKTILNSTGKLSKGVKNKLVTLQWTLSTMIHIGSSRIPALQSLKLSEKFEPSLLVRNCILHTVDVLSNYNMKSSNEGFVEKLHDLFDGMSYRDIRQLEDELYEYNIMVKNCDQQDDALTLTRELNTRISILDDLMLSKKLNEVNFKKCSQLKDRYIFIRKQLVDKKLYSGKTLGLFVELPTIKDHPNM